MVLKRVGRLSFAEQVNLGQRQVGCEVGHSTCPSLGQEEVAAMAQHGFAAGNLGQTKWWMGHWKEGWGGLRHLLNMDWLSGG